MQETLSLKITGDNKDAVAALKQTQQSLFNLKERLMEYQNAAFTEKDVNKIRNYNVEIQKLQGQIKQLSNAGKEGFDQFGNSIKGVENPLTKAYSGLRQIAYILPGIGIAGIFNLAFDAIGKGAESLGLFAKKSDEAAEAAKKFNDEVLKQREGAEKEISQLRALESVAANSALSMNKRKQAVKELRDQYPAYFKDLTDEQILTGNITTATNNLTAAIYARAEARAREADIAKKATQIFENQQKIDELREQLEKKREQRIAAQKNAGGQTFGGSMTGISASGNDATVKAATLLGEEKTLLSDIDALLTENSRLQIQVGTSQQRVNQIKGETIALDEKETDGIKKKTKAIDEYASYFKSFYKRKGLMPSAQTVSSKNEDNLSIENPTGKLSKENNLFDTENEAFADKKLKQMKEYNVQLELAKSIADSAASSFSKLFDALAAGQSIGDALKNIFMDLAKQILAAVVRAFVLKQVMNLLGLTAGVATGGIGGAFAMGLGQGIGGGLVGNARGYADGGISTGPASGHLELLHGTEAIFPMDKLAAYTDKAMKIGALSMGDRYNSPIVLDSVVRGNDIWLSQKRTDYYRGLTT